MTSHPVGGGSPDVDTPGTGVRTAPDRAAVARAVLVRAEQRTGARRWSGPSVEEAAARAQTVQAAARLAPGAEDRNKVEVRKGLEVHRPSGDGSVVRPAADLVRERPPLPVPVALTDLLPEGLPRGGTVVVAGSTSLLLALVSEASRAGSWVAMVGLDGVGLLAAEEVGVVLTRLALVPDPGAQAAVVVAALIDGMDVVVLGPGVGLTGVDRRRLMARARERGSVLVSTAPWAGASLVLTAERQQWSGLGAGDGRLRAQQVTVRRNGRGSAAVPLRREVVLRGGSVRAATATGNDDLGGTGSGGEPTEPLRLVG